jgi:hypothetical protein
MNNLNSKSGRRVGIHKVTHRFLQEESALPAILHDMLQTREVRESLISVVSEFLHVWAGKSWWKKMASKMGAGVVKNQLSQPEDVFAKKDIERLFESEQFMGHISELLPEVTNSVLEALVAGGRNLEGLSADRKRELFSDILTGTGKGYTGELLTSCARVLNHIHKDDPEFFARTLEPGFKEWIEAMDFGELKEAVENSEKDARATVEMANNVIWEYPAKVVMILSLIPSLLNMITQAAEISVEKLNEVPPDLLTDIVLSFVREINGGNVARVVDELTEIVRKIHTGSALLGEPGAPKLPKVLSELLDEVVTQTDATTFWKARIGLAELKADFDQALTGAIDKNPEYVRLGMNKKPELFNIHMRSLNRKWTSLESMDDEELADTMAQRLSGYDVHEVAEVFNNMVRTANRLWEQKPETGAEIMSQFVNALDYDELEGAAKQLFGDMRQELRPVARTVVPGLVEWVCDVLQPEDDENEDDAARARDALRRLFMAEEV